MATSIATQNPFSSLASSIAGSRLAHSAIERNLQQRTALEQRRQQFRSIYTAPANEARAVESQTTQAPPITAIATPAPKATNAFASLGRQTAKPPVAKAPQAPVDASQVAPAPAQTAKPSGMFSRAEPEARQPAPISQSSGMFTRASAPDNATPAASASAPTPPVKRGLFTIGVDTSIDEADLAYLDDYQSKPSSTWEPSVSAPAQPPVKPVKRGLFTIGGDTEVSEADFAYQDDAPSKPRSSGSGMFQRSGSTGGTSGQRSGTPAGNIVYTDEMKAVIDCQDPLIVVDAFAGCGKTTTAVGFADARPNERILYMCLNKANAKEAQERFGPNVTAATTHSVAWRAMKPNADRVTARWKPVLLMDQLKLNSPREGMVTMRILTDFFNSADTTITEKHAEAVAYERDLTASEINNGVAFATLAWKRMLDPNDKLSMPHDAYLKMFALKAPKLNYDRIIFDEAQDANPVTLQILQGQRNCKILCIGDRHQSIYQFRGSVNAMEKLAVGATHLHLSQTWRFGPKVAEIANLILGEFKDEKVKIRGMGTDADWNNAQVTTLSRTNAELFRLAAPVRGEGVHWVGGVDNYPLDQVIDAYHLYIRERALIKDELMRRKFASWDEYVKYADDANDGEAKVLTKVVEEFTDGIPELVEDIRKNAVPNSQDAAMTLTTAHRAKGLDWDYVRISDDFKVLEEAENIAANHPGADMPIQDINLLYVAVTRAKKGVELNEETVTWLENLPKHRSDREAAATRMLGMLNDQRAAINCARM